MAPIQKTIAPEKSDSIFKTIVESNPQDSTVPEYYPILNDVAIRVQNFDTNIDQKLITVTEDKILICLQNHLKRIGRKKWINPLSLLMSLLLALATSEFDKLTWVNSELLKAIFIVSSIITAGWLVWSIMLSAKLKEVPEVIGDIFAELKGV